ncbi:hypothetical protein E4J66_09345 [Actinomyces viscosus]|uniref:PPi-type phosphoenolpyruvate carboxykinase lobe 2 domain-containing protein n=1 Tax=Actinomyces viscosus TaxID=1656 RepID=A0A3S4VYC5_ACTVI|nr:hypothetical protein [Actinomyces viscosus]TFH52079.1 hypothetical protein E4J66_09345 [Actinomyces viscosus]VEI17579.1 Uncharacterised protein [Actinomyces viscosus]
MTTTDAATTSAIALRLELLGISAPAQVEQSEADRLMSPILARQRELSRRLAHRPCAADQRIQTFLDSYLEGAAATPQLPRSTFVLDQPGLARALSLPADSTSFTSDYVESYKVLGGVLHNPRNDRRTTAGVFHVAEGGLPIPDDKIAVPRDVFARLLAHAVEAPEDLLTLPWASRQEDPARCFVSLLLRPVVVPEVPGFSAERSMEIRFIAPGGLVSNLDFVEGIFGNGGDPYLPENDASLAPESWTGHTGCVILAPHLTTLTKKELGLPSWEEATERQRRDGQCWKDEDELYNDGKAFKCVARDERGVIVTVIADNYFGYCKKEVKTQIGYSANLFGCVEEEHAGGAIAYPRYNLGQEYTDIHTPEGLTLEHVVERNPGRFEMREDGSAVVVDDPTVVLVPAGAHYSMRNQTITWTRPDGQEASIPLLVSNTYVAPNGYRVHAKHREGDATQWHLVGTAPWSTQAHKPATVSGGGKSEISKSLLDAFVFGEAYVGDVDEDFDTVQKILDGNYADRFVDPANKSDNHRSILSERRSLGSVIKLLTPSSMYTDEYNAFLESIPAHIKELIFTVKRFYQPSWGKDWRSHFSVGIINGRKGNSLRLDEELIKVNMLRVGFEDDGAWRLLSLRPDFSPAAKVQTEDDITASIVAPGGLVSTPDSELSRKFVTNCESLLFQRPDDAIVRGYDKQTESDMSDPDADLFISNFEPLTPEDARAMAADAPGLSRFTQPMQDLVARAAALPEAEDPAEETYWVSTADPRLVGGTPTKNPRYLQVRPDIANPKDVALADLTNHLFHDVPLAEPLRHSVDVVAAGRRNNPPEDGVPPLCAYNPLHYMELPELFMEFISSMTGKSPSTTGAGSEGALTKSPFNALPAIYDLNAALLSYALSGYDGWLSSAGYIGPKVQVAHDISLLIPEIFSRMSTEERDARSLIEGGYLERIEDFEYEGRTVQASRLGYRMNQAFASTFFGRIFLHPDVVFTEEMLRPELQDEAVFADSVDIIVTTHKVVAEHYRADGSIEWAVPPLRALLEIMIDGTSREGWDLTSPEFRALFERENILNSSWYAARLDAKVARDTRQAHQAIEDLTRFYTAENNEEVIERLGIEGRLAEARAWLDKVSSPAYREHLVGTLGLQPTLA